MPILKFRAFKHLSFQSGGFTIDIWYLNCFLDSNDAIRINRTRIDRGFSKMCRSIYFDNLKLFDKKDKETKNIYNYI